MASKAGISLSTGMEDPEKVMVACLVAVGAAENGRPTLMFLPKEAVRLAVDGIAVAQPSGAEALAFQFSYRVIGVNTVGPATVGDDVGVLGQSFQVAAKLADRDGSGAGDVACCVLGFGPDVEHDDVALADAPG